ncbi:hypothetical protein CEG14_12885 [Bordetella genomosp. 1]|uniref:DUF72 domain-containing protein n=1 Tax=Bordetella genomosp. 1 TaxID=1395607 RepID=A0A261SHU7_9BORD|nr:DUF72 domain-containing protein [Bordetella genomosp. 1]OZI35933.1 hypothetical protein CEG14_12885 [Bordetella genomosp. 1]OZI58601.1 hypothetical protein CAL27_18100 [Bordetella genomosp. 1]
MASSSQTRKTAAPIRVGIGGWTFPPWRDGVFYPPGLAQSRELEYAASVLTAIEVNGTFYGSQKPATFAAWAEQVPERFVFSLKAPRFATHRRVLGEAGESVQRFLDSGIVELGPKLGPILWQLPATKAFDAADLEAFFALLPARAHGRDLTHVLDARHASFASGAYVRLARKHGIATVYTDSPDYPNIADRTADTVYARLMAASERYANGYAPSALARWHERAQAWARGEAPADLPRVVPTGPRSRTRQVFVYFINGDKTRAPRAAQALLARMKG